jgi:hypothetical protein
MKLLIMQFLSNLPSLRLSSDKIFSSALCVQGPVTKINEGE